MTDEENFLRLLERLQHTLDTPGGTPVLRDCDCGTCCEACGHYPDCIRNATAVGIAYVPASQLPPNGVDVPRYPTTGAEYAALPILRIDDFHQEQQ